jgi:hypothetical protein
MGTPVSQPTPPGPSTIWIQNPDGMVSFLMLTPLASRAGTPPPPEPVPPGDKPRRKKALPGDSELSIFDILNTFRCCWFLSVAHLRAQAPSAQKAKDGKKFWVKFSPQYHAHLVKCAIVLVP